VQTPKLWPNGGKMVAEWADICPVCKKRMAKGNKYCSLYCYNEENSSEDDLNKILEIEKDSKPILPKQLE